MNVPLLDLKRQYQSIKTEIDQAVARVIESGQFIMGSEVEEFEHAVAEYLGVTHAMGVASGTDALYLSLCAAGIGPGDKVIVPAFTFFATAGAVSNVGAIPLFCDIEPETFNLDVSHVRHLRPVLRQIVHGDGQGEHLVSGDQKVVGCGRSRL